MSPEQASATAIDRRSDVYAFGVLAYETLTGRLPFDGDTPLATLMKHQSDTPVPPRRFRPELPPEVERIVLRALGKRPEDRQQSMHEISTQLAQVAAEPDVLRALVFGTAVAPLLTGRSTGRMEARTSGRGSTMPLGDTLPLRDLAPPAPEATPTRPSTRIRRDTRAEVEVMSRRRSQMALAAVLGLLFVALLSGVVAALASRRGDGADAAVSPRAGDAGRAGEPPAVRVTAPDPTVVPAASAAPPQPAPAQSPAAAPTPERAQGEPPGDAAAASVEPPPSVSAAAPPPPRPARSRPARGTGGVGSRPASGDNAAPGNDLLDPYGPTGR
jgi:serine/threonine-protein kinase